MDLSKLPVDLFIKEITYLPFDKVVFQYVNQMKNYITIVQNTILTGKK